MVVHKPIGEATEGLQIGVEHMCGAPIKHQAQGSGITGTLMIAEVCIFAMCRINIIINVDKIQK